MLGSYLNRKIAVEYRKLGRVHTNTQISRTPFPLNQNTLSPMKRGRECDAVDPVGTSIQPRISANDVEPISFTAPSAMTRVAIDTSTYQSQLDSKLSKLHNLFGDLKIPELEVFSSIPQNYRMRAEFNVWGTRADETPSYVMFATSPEDGPETDGPAPEDTEPSVAKAGANSAAEKPLEEGAVEVGGKSVQVKLNRKKKDAKQKKPPRPRVEISHFPVGSVLMNELMPLVLTACSKNPVLKERLFQVNYHTTLNGDSAVTLLYHKKLDEQWTEAARALRPVLAAAAPSANGHVPHIIGRSRKQKVCLDQDFVLEKLTVHGRQYLYRQFEGSFSQPNGYVCQKMLEWAVDVTRGSADHDLLELYCGNGNFTLPLSQNFRRVVATEVSKVGVDAAKWNIQANGETGKIFVGRLSSEEFVQTWKEKGTRRRLEGLWEWSDLNLRTLFVDPPRAGLDDDTVKLMATFDRIVYISCNPETLYKNIQGIVGVTHDLVRFAAFDQFPFTHHLESGVYLVKKPLVV